MNSLRLKQSILDNDEYKIELRLSGDIEREAEATFKFILPDQDRRDLRWYLEEYLDFPVEPGERLRAENVEKRIQAVGTELFKAVFQSDDDTRDLWAILREDLNNTRVEIVTSVQEATAIPWELLRDPRTDVPIALRAQSFVRTENRQAGRAKLPQTESGPIRILLVICRPGGGNDVAFRSVASQLVKALNGGGDTFQLDVLRPPTFAQLSSVLRAAKAEDKPYHIVHFDGHGTYLEVPIQPGANDAPGMAFDANRFSGLRGGKHGYLAFERPEWKNNLELVDGPSLGKLLNETDTPVLVLNACQSAYAEPDANANPAEGDIHASTRAFGSLAQEVIDAGVAGVVAMRYSVYVVTAAQFMYDLYLSLVGGQSLGEAVTLGRKQLEAKPERSIAYPNVTLQDWSVPLVYEAAPIILFHRQAADPALKITLKAGESAAPVRGLIAESLPPVPDAGFFGRDETLLALDRAFDTQPIVLLQAFAGSGKTTTAAEFARWYALTGGVNGPVLFTTFERYKPLARVLDDFGRVFGGMLEQQVGIHWLALPDEARRDVALQVMGQIPLLWLWDNVEPVTGFPAGTPSVWTAAEQRELVDFLRAARATKAKFLLTSRRDEHDWLGDLPRRVVIPAMPMRERVQLAKALAEKRGHRITDLEDWRPLLRFTQGNPLTITVLVGQALRDGLKTRKQIEAFVERLRQGEAAFTDEADEGRGKSLGASLNFGFDSAFTDDERKILALLHLFQGFVDVDALRWMGNEKVEYHLPEVSSLTRETGMTLLDKAAEIGLLNAIGGGYYTIHPALPWFFKTLFDQYYPAAAPAAGDANGTGLRALRAFTRAIGTLGDYYTEQYMNGNREVIAIVGAEEANLLHARRLARTHGWWRAVISTMQSLDDLYNHTGRRAEWKDLVDEIIPDFCDPVTDGPLPGRDEEHWAMVIEDRVSLAQEERDYVKAEYLQNARVTLARQRAASALVLPPDQLDSAQKNTIRSLAASLDMLGQIQMEQGEASCVKSIEEAADLLKRIGDRAAEAVAAFNLGNAYEEISSIRDLEQAEKWYRRSLDLRAQNDRLGRSKSLSLLGYVAFERFKEAQATNQSEANQIQHLNAALNYYTQALDLLPPDAVNDLAVVHNQLGVIYKEGGDLERAVSHYRESIRYKESSGNFYGAGGTRYNVADILYKKGRLQEAQAYAKQALQNFQHFGDRAGKWMQNTQHLLALIEQAMPK